MSMGGVTILEISFTLRKGRGESYFLKCKRAPYITVPCPASLFLHPYL